MTIAGDNDFYSQDRSVRCTSLRPIVTPRASSDRSSTQASTSLEPDPFAFLDTALADVHKTGLGSSAAMVTSLVAAVLLHASSTSSVSSSFSGTSISERTKRLMHNAAQFAHSQAQGKVGSGFDVSAAVFGSQIYKRFSPKCLSELLESTSVRFSVISAFMKA